MGVASASGDDDSLKKCMEMKGQKNELEELRCYRDFAARQQRLTVSEDCSKPDKHEQNASINRDGSETPGQVDAKNGETSKESKAEKKPHGMPPKTLTEEWDTSATTLMPYKQNYILFYSLSSQTNNAPTSPNLRNRVLSPSPMDDRDMKFQLSMKGNLAAWDNKKQGLWFGYTQLSFWQVYDASNSRPFRENNYEPEFIYSYRFDPCEQKCNPNFALMPKIINIGAVHQSNGQSDPRSRSWNRVYLQAGLDNSEDGKSPNSRSLSVMLRLWKRINESPTDDDNPDITHYLGHGDIEARYSHDKMFTLSATGRVHSLQLDLAVPWFLWAQNVNMHIQYFTGYGESLIDYNQRHHTFGFGASFPF